MAIQSEPWWKKILRGSVVFGLGCGLSFLTLFGVLGWSIAAFLSLGAALSLGFLIAPALIVLGGLLFTGLFYAAWAGLTYATRSTVEHSIEHCFEEINECTHYNPDLSNLSASFDELNNWLTVANDGQSNKHCLNYPYKGQTLLSYALKQSEVHSRLYKQYHPAHESKNVHYRNHLLLAQEWTKLVHRLSTPNAKPTLTNSQRFILWLKGLTGVTWDFTEVDVPDDAAIIDSYTQGLDNKTQQTVKNIFTPAKPMVMQKEEIQPTSKLATTGSLNHWAEQLVLVQQQQQQHQQQQQQVTLQQNETVDLSLDACQQAQLLVDNSALHTFRPYEYGSEYSVSALGSHWFKPFIQALFAESDRLGLLDKKIASLSLEEQNQMCLMSEQAKTAIYTSANLRFNTDDDFDLTSLHGFWIELRQDKPGFIIKYDPEYQKKTKHKLHQPLFIQPALLAMMRVGATYTSVNRKYLSLLQPTTETFKCHGLAFEVYQAPNYPESWVQSLAQAQEGNLPKPPQIVPVLKALAEELGLTEQQWKCLYSYSNSFPMSSFVEMYKQSPKVDTRRFIQFLAALELRGFEQLMVFARYWNAHPHCNWTRHVAELEQITTFNAQEFAWFDALLDTGGDLEELVQGLVYFFNFFKDKNIVLPAVISAIKIPPGIANMGSQRFLQLRGILECMTLTQIPELQSRWMEELPSALTVAKKQLLSGYAVVHRAMCFGGNQYCYDGEVFRKRFPQLIDPLLISPQEFAALEYQTLKVPETPVKGWKGGVFHMTAEQEFYLTQGLTNPISYRAFFLRYCAANLDAHYFQQALARWEALMGEDFTALPEMDSKVDPWWYYYKGEKVPLVDALEQKLQTHWNTLKEDILNMPTKTSVKQEQNNWLLKKTTTEKCYAPSDVKRVLDKLGVGAEERQTIEHDINYLNERAITFPQTHNEFQKAIDEAVQTFRQLANTPGEAQHQAMLECLVLMREAHYRLSHKKKGNGEWLRLEQAIVILLDYRHSGLWQIKTDEGKTLILQFISMLQTLQGKVVTVITHNQTLAGGSCAGLKPLARLFGLTVAHKTSSSIEEGNITYTDIATAVINQKRAELTKPKAQTSAIQVVKIDEVDNVIVDVHADTTMQISDDAGAVANDDLIQFLYLLNQTVRVDLINQVGLNDKKSQREFVASQLQGNPYYNARCQNNNFLDRWISAAVTAMQLKEKIHYVIEADQVRIVHKDTTGRVDRLSQWGKGVHQCVAAWEQKNQGRAIGVPALAQVLAEGNVLDYLRTEFDERSGFSGTIGDAALQKEMEQVLFADTDVARTYFVPPAQRVLVDQDKAWPIIMTEQVDGETQQEAANKRLYTFKPQIFAEKKEHLRALLTAVENTQAQDFSAIVFLDTIDECDRLAEFLIQNGIAAAKIQILDDTEDHASNSQTKLRPGEATVIDQAKKPGMITLSTATGGRGTDFDEIEVGINAKPSMQRVEEQAEGRLARHSGFSMYYELYWQDDLGIESVSQNHAQGPLLITEDQRLLEWQKAKQAQQLDRISARKAPDEFKQQQQRAFFEKRRELDSSQRADLDKAWSTYFTNLCWQVNEASSTLPTFQYTN